MATQVEQTNILRGIMNGLVLAVVLWAGIFALACPAHAQTSKPMKAMITTWAACQAFDAVSTYVALRDPRIKEGNPIMRGPQLYAVKISVNLALGVTQHAIMTREPHSKKRFVLPLTLAASGCTAGILNTRTVRNLK